MSRKTKIKVFKIILIIMVLFILIGATIYLIPVMKNLTTEAGQLEFKQKINDSGFLGLILLFGLQVAQIFLFILPGEPIEILAGMCYGGLWGTIFITISAFIISSAIVFLVRKLGRNFVYDFCEEEKVKKLENNKLFKNPKKIEAIMIILFIIPGTPKDLLVYIAGLLPINPLRFVFISTFARFPSVISSTIAGANLAIGNWKMSILIYLITFIIVGIFIFIFNKFDKNKLTEQTFKSMKEEIK